MKLTNAPVHLKMISEDEFKARVKLADEPWECASPIIVGNLGYDLIVEARGVEHPKGSTTLVRFMIGDGEAIYDYGCPGDTPFDPRDRDRFQYAACDSFLSALDVIAFVQMIDQV
jgi:hypothetical protein